MANIPSYLERRSGKAKISYPDPALEEILKETFGIIVYQEQIMQIANQYAGYSLGEADVLRRAVSKKKEDVLVKRAREIRAEVRRERAMTKHVANEIYDYDRQIRRLRLQQVPFRRLRARRVLDGLSEGEPSVRVHGGPARRCRRFGRGDHDYVRECRKLGIKVLPPDINRSGARFRIEADGLRFPFQGIRGIGPSSPSASRKSAAAFSSPTSSTSCGAPRM
ncbi:MAG: hypothetical protein MZU95_08115 [Desulfomicrobium escambiense]|nr:hypothetical protein [Desulfomicrobium escambiense]